MNIQLYNHYKDNFKKQFNYQPNDLQIKAIATVFDSSLDSVAVIGKAGTGKSFTSKEIRKIFNMIKSPSLAESTGNFYKEMIPILAKYLSDRGLSFSTPNSELVITATTHKAASLIGGITINSALKVAMMKNINIHGGSSTRNRESSTIDSLWVKLGKHILIDEASMLTNDLYKILQQLRNHKYGTIKLIYIGDIGQLPPVEFGVNKSAFTRIVEGEDNTEIVELTKIFRHTDGSDLINYAANIYLKKEKELRQLPKILDGYINENNERKYYNSIKGVQIPAILSKESVKVIQDEVVEKYDNLVLAPTNKTSIDINKLVNLYNRKINKEKLFNNELSDLQLYMKYEDNEEYFAPYIGDKVLYNGTSNIESKKNEVYKIEGLRIISNLDILEAVNVPDEKLDQLDYDDEIDDYVNIPESLQKEIKSIIKDKLKDKYCTPNDNLKVLLEEINNENKNKINTHNTIIKFTNQKNNKENVTKFNSIAYPLAEKLFESWDNIYNTICSKTTAKQIGVRSFNLFFNTTVYNNETHGCVKNKYHGALHDTLDEYLIYLRENGIKINNNSTWLDLLLNHTNIGKNLLNLGYELNNELKCSYCNSLRISETLTLAVIFEMWDKMQHITGYSDAYNEYKNSISNAVSYLKNVIIYPFADKPVVRVAPTHIIDEEAKELKDYIKPITYIYKNLYIDSHDETSLLYEDYVITNKLVVLTLIGTSHRIYVLPSWLRDQFIPAYCITIHKSQGSECKNVIIYLISKGDIKVWNTDGAQYTAITRAKNEAHIVYTDPKLVKRNL